MAVIDSYSETNADEYWGIDSSEATAFGQSFTGNGSVLSSAQFYLKKQGSPTGNMTAYLYAHSGTYGTNSIATGSPLDTSATIDISTLTTSAQLITFTFSGSYTVVNTTKYCILVEYTGGNSSNKLLIGVDVSSPSHGGNLVLYWGGWDYDGATDVCFYVNGNISGASYTSPLPSFRQP